MDKIDKFEIVSEYKPTGDQPRAVEKLTKGILENKKFQTLLGVTGSGKTFTMANIIEKVQRPTLVIAHNKTLAAQLCSEFKEYFPDNAVEYFVSYYDYYQPEAYVPSSDTYIEKDSSVNDEIDKLRHSATASLFERRDVIIVASVSCIYGLGSPVDYENLVISLRPGMIKDRDEIITKLIEIQYKRNDINFTRGTFRVRGDVLEVFPASSSEEAVRIEFFGDEVERITEVNSLTGEMLGRRKHISIYPASHYATTDENIQRAVGNIGEELVVRLKELKDENMLVEAQRLEQRTKYDIEMLREMGFCNGIENYSRHINNLPSGTRPYTLIDYFPDDFLMIIDESHVTVPQVRGMFKGDRSRKQTLVDFGFRLPSALDNRPLQFKEFEKKINTVVFVSATPGPYEYEHTEAIAEQIIRPTGLIDPEITVKPVDGHIDDLIHEIRKTVEKNQRILVTTLTKRMSEDLTFYLKDVGLNVRYLHSDIDTIERMEILRDLRLGKFDILIGINLLREGLDLPEVSLVAILDADKEGLFRSETALIQTIGRAARNIDGRVIMYADRITKSMDRAISETNRRREIQEEYNKKHGITPQSIMKNVRGVIEATSAAEEDGEYTVDGKPVEIHNEKDLLKLIDKMNSEMMEAAKNLEFEKAATIRDEIKKMKKLSKIMM
jgi:excinuclease ABC subunit B